MTLLEDWLTVIGLLLLTFGTGTQAFASLGEFRNLRTKVTKGVWKASKLAAAITLPVGGIGIPFALLTAPLLVSGILARLRAEGGDDAVELARFIRQVEVWTILMVGSALTLAAAIIQLTLA